MKTCTRCGKEKHLAEFHRREKSKDGHQVWCKPCANKARAESYRRHPRGPREYVSQTRARNRLFVLEYLLAHPCADCGEQNPVLLDFDHVRGKKRESICEMTSNASLDSIRKEISKCEVRCVSCHRLKTARDFGWYRSIEVAKRAKAP